VETEEQYLVLKAMGCDLVQGYYFSKPVPPEAFDRFLIERSGEAADAHTAKTEKTAVSISEALTGDFERIFYVDVLTDFYLEFVTGEDGKLEIHPGGIDFFDSARKNLLQDVAEDDAAPLREATGKANLIRLAEQNESVTLSFRRMKNGVPTPYTLQTIRTRESDRHHIVIGVKKEETAPKS
jgi:hypothetical protein